MPNQIAFYPQSSGGAGSVTLISTQTLGVAAASIVVSAIPSTYTHLKVVASLINVATNQQVIMQFNGDTTGSHYASTIMGVSGTSVTGSTIAEILIMLSSLTVPAANDLTIVNYKSSGFKNITGTAFNPASGVAQTGGGIWNQGAAISSITLTNADASNFGVGSLISVYGLQ